MKTFQKLIAVALAATFVVTPWTALAADKSDKNKKAKPYPLKTCVVSDETLGADPNMKPYTFEHDGREVKLCCKSCLKHFNKDKAKYVKKIEAAEKKKK